MHVYHHAEVEAFAQVFYLPPAQQRTSDHARLEAHLQPAVGRFGDLDEDEQMAFRDRLSAFVHLYAFLSQVIPYGDSDLERLSSYGRILLPHLQPDHDADAVHLGDDVELEYYRLQRVSQVSIAIAEGGGVYVTGPGEMGSGDPEDEQAPLSEIIERLNERFGTSFTDEDRLFFEQVRERAVRDEDVRNLASANTFEKFALGLRPQLEKLMIGRMADNDAIVTRYLDDPDFRELATEVMAREIFAALETDEGEPLNDASTEEGPVPTGGQSGQ